MEDGRLTCCKLWSRASADSTLQLVTGRVRRTLGKERIKGKTEQKIEKVLHRSQVSTRSVTVRLLWACNVRIQGEWKLTRAKFRRI